MKKKSKVTADKEKDDIQHPSIDSSVPIVNSPEYSIVGLLANGYISRDTIAQNNLTVNVGSWQGLVENGTKPRNRAGYPQIYLRLDESATPDADDPTDYFAGKGAKDPAWTAAEIANGLSFTLDVALLSEKEHFIIPFLIPLNLDEQQVTRLNFNVLTSSSGGDVMPLLKFDKKYVDNGITDLNLKDDPTAPSKKVLPAILVPYYKQRDGDKIGLYLGDSIASLQIVDTVTIGDGESGKNKEVTFDKGLFDTFADGPLYFTYMITNPAGFVSPQAEHTIVQLAFGDLPTGLVEPVLPDIKKNLITDEFIHPLHIDIPIYANPALDDIIRVFFKQDDGLAGDGTLISTSPPLEDPTQNPIYSTEAVYNQIKPFDQKSVIIYYTVSRGESSLLKTPSSPLTVPVNLTILGGPNPDQPAKENGNLQALTITSAQGEINRITGPAVLIEADITIPYKTRKDETYLAVGDVISVTVGKATVTNPPLIAIPAADITVKLTVANIKLAGEGDMIAQYTVRRPLPDTNSIMSLSPKTGIFITSNNSNPGGKNGLTAPTWKNDTGVITVSSVKKYSGCDFRVKRYENIAPGQMIELIFEGTEGYEDEDGEKIPAASYKSDPLEIVAGNIDDDDFAFIVPPKNIYALCQGTAHVTYNVLVAGTSFKSSELLKYCDVSSASSGACTLPTIFE
ncbi:hypothetical protein [Yersinia bercovieri]|uniref:hypothetical protein n=1 Tax=Yersinia bercovieri TaxID=634 RepID=UPI00119DFAB8|nr:hypothetical protein [Yersinia bercovieri]